MKINFDTILKDFNDKEIGNDTITFNELTNLINQSIIQVKSTDVKSLVENLKEYFTYEPFTLKTACFNVLGATIKGEENLSGKDKMKRFELAMKIKDSGEINLTSEEITLLKELIGKMYGTLIVGRCYEILDPKED